MSQVFSQLEDEKQDDGSIDSNDEGDRNDDSEEKEDIDWTRCKHEDHHCTSCTALIASPYLLGTERRTVGCCHNSDADDCHAWLQQVQDVLDIVRAQGHPTAAAHRFACYQRLVCVESFGISNPDADVDDPRLLLDCCILFRVRCTWPSPTGNYTGHEDVNGYAPIAHN